MAPTPRLLPDLTGSAEIVLKTESAGVVLPQAALFQENGGPFVYLQTPNGWLKRPVDVGLESHTAAAVRSGLRTGDVVALRSPL